MPKYNDRYTLKQCAKHVEKVESLDNECYYNDSRKNRRERERKIFKFSCKVYTCLDKKSWDLVPLRIKEDICNDWYFGFIDDSRNCWTYRTSDGGLRFNYDHKQLSYNKDFYKDKFNSWLLKQIKRKVDKSTYRDILINNLVK